MSFLGTSLSGHLQTRNGPPLDVEPSIGGVFSCFSGKAGTKVDAETRKIQRCALWSLLPSHFTSELSFKIAAEEQSLAPLLLVFAPL